jgi:hypothetical protein
VGALRIAVSGSVLGTSLVGGVLGQTTIGIHLGEVDGTVETAAEVGDIDIKSELLVLELEHLVGGVAGKEVHARTDVGAGLEFEGQGVTRGSDTIGTRVVGTIQGTVGSTSLTVGAEGAIPSVTGVAVGIAGGRVQPTPVGVEHDRASLRSATRRSALGPAKGGVGLGLLGTDLLSGSKGNGRKERGKRSRELHDGQERDG